MSQTPANFVRSIPRSFLRALVVRIIMAVVLLASVALAWWSWNRLQPVRDELEQKTTQSTRLANDVQQLEMRWDAPEAERVDIRYQHAQTLLFNSPDELLKWQRDLKRETLGLALDANAQVGKPQPHPRTQQKLSLLTATVDLQPAAVLRSTNSPYKRVLGFTRGLENPKKRMDLVELSVSGSSNSVQQARAIVQLWSQEKPSP